MSAGELQRLRARIAELERSISEQVDERVEVIMQAQRVANIDHRGKTTSQIRAAAVAAVRGPAAIDGRSEEYILAVWDHLQETLPVDPVRFALKTRPAPMVN